MKHTSIVKVASPDNNNFIFLDKILKLKKKCIISTGLLNYKQIEFLVTSLKRKYSINFLEKSLCLLHCVSSYPVKDNDMNLNFIKKMQKRYKLPIGFSDHSIGIEASMSVAAALGASNRKTFPLDNNFSNFRDHKVSLNPVNFKRMVVSIRRVENLMERI